VERQERIERILLDLQAEREAREQPAETTTNGSSESEKP
jgi:hypothetical protein